MPYPVQYEAHGIPSPTMAIYRPACEDDYELGTNYLAWLDHTGLLRSEFSRRQSHAEDLSKQLDASASVPANWDSYGAESPSPDSIAVAHRVLSLLFARHLQPTRIVPSAEGGIGLCFVEDDKYADIECLNTAEILAVKYRGQEQPEVWEIDASSDKSLLDSIELIRVHLAD